MSPFTDYLSLIFISLPYYCRISIFFCRHLTHSHRRLTLLCCTSVIPNKLGSLCVFSLHSEASPSPLASFGFLLACFSRHITFLFRRLMPLHRGQRLIILALCELECDIYHYMADIPAAKGDTKRPRIRGIVKRWRKGVKSQGKLSKEDGKGQKFHR